MVQQMNAALIQHLELNKILMNTYAVNLTVDTKTTDLYDQVAINKYPIIVLCKDEKELWDKLSSQDTTNWVRANVKTQRLFDSAYFHIREINVGEVNDICWKVDSLITMVY
jgi:hypothetical protein